MAVGGIAEPISAARRAIGGGVAACGDDRASPDLALGVHAAFTAGAAGFIAAVGLVKAAAAFAVVAGLALFTVAALGASRRRTQPKPALFVLARGAGWAAGVAATIFGQGSVYTGAVDAVFALGAVAVVCAGGWVRVTWANIGLAACIRARLTRRAAFVCTTIDGLRRRDALTRRRTNLSLGAVAMARARWA